MAEDVVFKFRLQREIFQAEGTGMEEVAVEFPDVFLEITTLTEVRGTVKTRVGLEAFVDSLVTSLIGGRGKSLATIFTRVGFLSRVDRRVAHEVLLVRKGHVALAARKTLGRRRVGMVQHVMLQRRQFVKQQGASVATVQPRHGCVRTIPYSSLELLASHLLTIVQSDVTVRDVGRRKVDVVDVCTQEMSFQTEGVAIGSPTHITSELFVTFLLVDAVLWQKLEIVLSQLWSLLVRVHVFCGFHLLAFNGVHHAFRW